jgi:hypothetical protein
MELLALLLLLPVILNLRAADFPDALKLPSNKEFPDPLVMRDGSKITTAKDWREKRRPELAALIQHYMYGTLPPPAKVEAKVVHVDEKAFAGKATLRELELQIGAPDIKAPAVHLLLVTPNARKTPAPVFVGLNFSGNHSLVEDKNVRVPTSWVYPNYANNKGGKASEAGRGKHKDTWAIEQTIDRGYAVATMYVGDLDPDRKEVRAGLRPFFDKDEKAATIAFWSWGIQRIVDHLLTEKTLHKDRIIVVGHSRLGKTALLAAAFDERIALAIPSQAGCGGTAPNRTDKKDAESVERINTAFPHWFNAEFKKFNKDTSRLPFDQHSLTALVAPRPVLFSNAVEDAWANPEGQFEILRAAEPVWKLLGVEGLKDRKMPELGALSGGKLGYYIREGKHSMTPTDWKVFCDFADLQLVKK